jgi:hypothetical protein
MRRRLGRKRKRRGENERKKNGEKEGGQMHTCIFFGSGAALARCDHFTPRTTTYSSPAMLPFTPGGKEVATYTSCPSIMPS